PGLVDPAILQITYSNQRDTILTVIAWLYDSIADRISLSDQCTESRPWEAFRIRGGVAEHVEEDGLGEGVELGEGGAALGPQRVRLVQDLRNPPLLGEGREGDRAALQVLEVS